MGIEFHFFQPSKWKAPQSVNHGNRIYETDSTKDFSDNDVVIPPVKKQVGSSGTNFRNKGLQTNTHYKDNFSQ